MVRSLYLVSLLALLPLAGLGCSDSQAAPAQHGPEDRASIQVAPEKNASAPAQSSKAAAGSAGAPVAGGAPNAAATDGEAIVISAVGDCTLGTDYRVARAPGTFNMEMEAVGNDYRYPFSGVLEVLAADDLTIANLETTLSTATAKVEATFVFSGKPAYARILKEGSVEVVSTANNHSHDFGVAGYNQTIEALKENGVGFFGHGHVDRRVIKGVEVINLGYTGGRSEIRGEMVRAVQKHKRPENLVIISFHWGIEGINQPIDEQKTLGRAAIDAGADLVLGHHPHVLQGIEERDGKHIVYSLGNFVFGGHSNPNDKDSMIYQALFTRKNGRVTPAGSRMLPVRISTATDRNDYRPVLLEGAEKDRVLARVEHYSAALHPKSGRGRGERAAR